MTQDSQQPFQSGAPSWNLPEGESRRQAIAPLRGYVYQLHASLAAWLSLPEGGVLHLEAAEDYARILGDPNALDAILEATQVKDTRESGSVTLNSADVKDAIERYWALREVNTSRRVRLIFLTTSPIGAERRLVIEGGPGLEVWRHAARGADCTEIRAALKARFAAGGLGDFLRDGDDETLREILLRPITWLCGEPALGGLEQDNRDAVVELAYGLGGTPELGARALDGLIGAIWRSIVSGSRTLNRADLLAAVQAAVAISVPSRVAVAGMNALQGSFDLETSGSWREVRAPSPLVAGRAETVQDLVGRLRTGGALWIHGATGLGKSILADLVGQAVGDAWRAIDFRGVSGPIAAERLMAARRAVARNVALRGLILDDLSSGLEADIVAPLTDLRATLVRQDVVCVVTSGNPPGDRIARALGLDREATAAAPSFSVGDATELATRNGGDGPTWGHFIWMVGGSGHPQLCDVVVAGLARRDWPTDEMQRWMSEGFSNPDVEDAQAQARARLIDQMDEPDQTTLARVSRIFGSFDKPLAVEVAGAPPQVVQPGRSLDRLAGHWIERLEHGRMRASPLVSGLAAEWLSTDELKALDHHIAMSILRRKTAEPDLVDAAFGHALAAGAVDLMTPFARLFFNQTAEERALVAGAMPLFRTTEAALSALLAHEPYAELMVRIAQHRLRVSIADPERVAASAGRLMERWEALPDDGVRERLGFMVHAAILTDPFSFGKLPAWFEWVQRFRTLPEVEDTEDEFGGRDELGEADSDVRADAGADPVGAEAARTGPSDEAPPDPVRFAFLAHAIQLRDMAALSRLFADLDELKAADRDFWLGALRTDLSWESLLIDLPWLKASESEGFDAAAAAAEYDRLGRMALGWGSSRIAGKCFRAKAMLVDEYVLDRLGAIAILDEADALLPDNLDLRRERAKIAWRAWDYQAAFDQLSAIADRMGDAEAFDAAFSLREAGASAGELGRWEDAVAFFDRALRAALMGTRGHTTASSIGLAADAAACRFMAGDRTVAVRAMASLLEKLANLDPGADLKSCYVHHVVGHIVMWMGFSLDGRPTLDGEPVAYIPGSASNPAPSKLIEGRPLPPRSGAWFLLARLALKLGVPIVEVTQWSGVKAMRTQPAMDILFRVDLVDAAIAQGDWPAFLAFAPEAAAARQFMTDSGWAAAPPDPMSNSQIAIPKVVLGTEGSAIATDYVRDGLVAFGAARGLQDRTTVDLGALAADASVRFGIDLVPVWRAGASDPTSVAAEPGALLASYVQRGDVDLERLFLLHLRFWEFCRNTMNGDGLWLILRARVREDWTQIVQNRSAFLASPMRTVPLIREALAREGPDAVWIGGVLAAGAEALRMSLDPAFKAALLADGSAGARRD